MEYLCQEVLPFINQLETSETTEGNHSSLILDLLMVLCDLLPHAGEVENIPTKISTVHSKLLVSD